MSSRVCHSGDRPRCRQEPEEDKRFCIVHQAELDRIRMSFQLEELAHHERRNIHV